MNINTYIGSNHEHVTKWTKSRDPTRLVLYEPAQFADSVDICTFMYTRAATLPE